MRDLIDIINNISEGVVGLSAGEITKYEDRFKKFIKKIQDRSAFTTVDGEQVIIDPREAARFQSLYDERRFTGKIMANVVGEDEPIPISKLLKTTEFGGAAAAAGDKNATAGKEALLVKPSNIGICDRDISAADFYETIANNQVLQSTEYGRVIINLAEYIVSGEEVRLPDDYLTSEKSKVRTAIVDYGGEYLGVLALLYDRSRFPAKARFLEWLGGDLADLVLNFPLKANTNLADSYASITNKNTNHTLNISSKGTGGGAAPAISGLKVPDTFKTNKKFAAASKFINICKDYGTIDQAFEAMDLIFKTNKDAIAEKWHKFLPFATKSAELKGLATKSIADKKQRIDTPLPKKYQILWAELKASPSASDGGKLVYSIKKEVADSINKKNAIPEFQTAILELLEMNFIQQYTDYRAGELTFATQWPAKLDGNISVENKSSANDPTAGGFSFKLGRTDDSVSSEPGEPLVDEPEEQPEPDQVAVKKSKKAAVSREKPEEKPEIERTGRARRR